MAIRMGYWDCVHCEQKGIEGPQRQCPGCGRPRDADVEFYTKDDAPEIDDPQLLQRAEAGADWHCPFCDTDNPAGQVQCLSCGGSDPNAKHREEKIILDADQPASAESMSPEDRTPKKAKSKAGLLIFLSILVVIGGLVWFFFLRSSPHTVAIDQATWRKSLRIEQLKTETKSGWLDEMPSNARELSRTHKSKTIKVQQGTKKVKVGKKDLGNGMFKDVYKKVPNMVEKQQDAVYVTYEIDRWVQNQTLKEERSDGREPKWPSFTATPTRRVASKSSRLILSLKDVKSGKTYSYSLKIPEGAPGMKMLKGYSVGKKFTAMITATGTVKSIK